MEQAGGVLVAGAVGSNAYGASPPSHRVAIEGMAFKPAELTLSRGEQVEWHNEDLVPHTVTAADKRFDSGALAAGASWAHTPDKAGEYAYVCTFHPTMRAVLRVK